MKLTQAYHPPPQLLKDRIILVTGAGDGIGRVAATYFAKYGASVILLGRTTAKLAQVYDEIIKLDYPQPAIYPMNLAGAAPKDFQDLASAIEQEFGHLDGLLHNAAILGGLTPIEHYAIETWHQVMQVNVNAAFMLSQACLGLLKKSQDASIVFTSSSVGKKGKAFWGAYAVSKFAVEGLAQVLADELESLEHIRVNCINPGRTRTNMRAQAYPAEDAAKLAKPEQLMNSYLYLLGPDSRNIKGQSIELSTAK